MKKNDFALILVLLIISILFALVFVLERNREAENLVVSVDGSEVGTYSLMEDREIPIGNSNIIVISDKQVFVKWADCPDQVCVNHKSISKVGESIICLPNRVVIEIKEAY